MSAARLRFTACECSQPDDIAYECSQADDTAYECSQADDIAYECSQPEVTACEGSQADNIAYMSAARLRLQPAECSHDRRHAVVWRHRCLAALFAALSGQFLSWTQLLLTNVPATRGNQTCQVYILISHYRQ